MLVVHEEISTMENFEYLKQNDSDKKELNNHCTTSSLHAQIKVKKCGFYKNKDHYSDQCKIVTNANSRKEILSKEKHCFNCFNRRTLRKCYVSTS